MGTTKVTATDRELATKKRRQKRLRRQRAREEALLGNPTKEKQLKPNVKEHYAIAEIVAEADDIIHNKADLARERNKDVPYIIGHKGVGRPAKGVGITDRLKEVLGARAGAVEDTKKYCEFAGIDPNKATVRDCVVHNMLHWALKGSAPHLKEIMERVDGRVPHQVDVRASGKMSITDAMNFIEGVSAEELDLGRTESEQDKEAE